MSVTLPARCEVMDVTERGCANRTEGQSSCACPQQTEDRAKPEVGVLAGSAATIAT